MSPESWERLAAQFAKEHKKGVTLKKFCDKHGVNYGTAKKYISVKKVAAANPRDKSPQAAKKLLKKSPRKIKQKSLAKSNSKSALKGAYIADDFGLTEMQFRFAQLVAEGKKKYVAYGEAGYSCPTKEAAYCLSSQLSRKPNVMRAIHYLKEQRQERYAFERDFAITQMVAILQADPNEISQYRRVNCRYCHGANHKYQWKDLAEQTKATATAAQKNQPAPDISGGMGFIETADPHPDCPRCAGEGTGKMFMADTRDLVGDARYLLEGVRMTKNGIEVITASKAEARKELMRIIDGGKGGGGEDEDLLAMKKAIAAAELRKKLAEAERIERENEMLKQGRSGGDEPTFVINLLNSPDADDEDDSDAPGGHDGQ